MSFTESLGDIIARDRSGMLAVADHWERVRLGDIASVVNGFPFPSNSFTPDRGVPLLRIRDVRSDRTEAFFDGEVEEAYLVRAGELVVGMDGDFHAALWRGPRAALNQRVCKIVPDETLYSVKLLAYVLPGYLNAINQATSSITVKHLSSRTVGDIPLPIPPRKEQDRLVAAIEEHLSRLDAAVAGLKRVQAQLPRYRAAVLKTAVEGRLVAADDEIARAPKSYSEAAHMLLDGSPTPDATTRAAPTTPDGWSWTSIGELKRFSMYGPRFPSEAYADAGPLVLRTSDIGDGGRVNLATAPRVALAPDELKRYRLLPGDLLVTRTGSLGTVAIFDDETPAIAGAYLIQFRLAAPLETSRYVLRFLQSPDGQRQLVGGGAGVGRPNLNAPTIEAIKIPLPPLTEQRRILAEVDRRLSLANAVEHEVSAVVERARSQRQSILRHAFEGKLIPQDPNDEPASVLLERIRTTRAAAPIKPERPRRAQAR